MKLQLILLAFLMGLIFCASYSHKNLIENFEEQNDNCPNLLVKRGNKLMLVNKRKANIPGVNPIFFDNLEDYVEFVQWQKSQGIECPVLYFNEMQDAQGNTNYRMFNTVSDPQAGLPSYSPNLPPEVPLYDANMDNPPYNQHNYPAFDENNQNVGRYTPIDKAFHSNKPLSASAMDVNWAGQAYTRRLIRLGKYDKDSRPTKDFSEGVAISSPYMKQQTLDTRPAASAGAPIKTAEIDKAKKGKEIINQ